MPLSGTTPGTLLQMILHLPGKLRSRHWRYHLRLPWCIHWGSGEELGIPGIVSSFPFYCALIPTGFQTVFGSVFNIESRTGRTIPVTNRVTGVDQIKQKHKFLFVIPTRVNQKASSQCLSGDSSQSSRFGLVDLTRNRCAMAL